MNPVRGRSVAVLGAAKSGVAAANLLADAGARRVVLSDLRSADQLDVASLSAQVEVVGGRNDLADADLVVTSPGVPPGAPPLAEAAARGIPIWSEPELAFRLLPPGTRVLAITGTDGKSTVTTMLGHIERTAAPDARPVWEGGNLGTPLCQAVLDGALRPAADGTPARAVVEMSCFQLLHVHAFRPRVAALLNIAEDHLDVHGDLDGYAAAKARVFENLRGPDDTAVYRADDRRCAAAAAAAADRSAPDPPRLVPFGPTPEVLAFWASRALDPARALPMIGVHNVLNAEAATRMAQADGIDRLAAADALAGYRPLRHRLEVVLDDPVTGVRWIDDSKATNPHAAAAVLRALATDPVRPPATSASVLLLAGGVDKGLPLARLVAAAREAGVRQAWCYGAIRERLSAALTGAVAAVHTVGTLAEAVEGARAAGERGDVVVLAPACSSFDQFSGYADRGDAFRRLVTGVTGAPQSG